MGSYQSLEKPHVVRQCLMHGDVKLLQQVLEEGAKLETYEDLDGPLHVAVEYGHLELVRFLVEVIGLDMLEPNGRGSTPLALARENKHKEVIKYLCGKINAFYLGDLLENMNDAVVMGSPTVTIIGFNAAAERLFGYAKHEVIGVNIKDVLIYPSEIRAKHDEFVSQHNKTGRKRLIGTQRVVLAKHKDGSELPVGISLAGLSTGCFLATFRPASEDQRKEVITNMKDAVILALPDGRIVAANEPLEHLFGYRQDELVGQYPSLLIWDTNLQQVHGKYVADYAQSGIQRFIGSRRAVNARRKDGTRLQVEIILSELADKYFLVTFRHIRPRSQVEQELLWSLEIPSQESDETHSTEGDSDPGTIQYVMHSSIYHLAISTCTLGDLEGLKVLVKNHLDLRYRDYEGNTLLHCAASGGYLEIVEYLLDQPGVSAELKNNNEQTAFDLALAKGHKKVASYIQEIQYNDRYITKINQTPTNPADISALKTRVCKMWVTANELVYEEELGRGRFGIVYKGQWRYVPVAIKNVKIAEKDYLDDLLNEATVMLELRPHPNVVGFLGVCWEKGHYAIITEFLSGGSLDRYLKKSGHISVSEVVRILLDVAMGVAHLHTENLVHRDLAARNVLLTGEIPPRAKIGDFGFAKVIEKHNPSMETFGGAVRWMPPESIKYNSFSIYSDAWSFGILCYECLSGELPFPGQTLKSLVLLIGTDFVTPTLPPHTPQFLSQLVQMCWSREPSERPTFHDIVHTISSHLSEF